MEIWKNSVHQGRKEGFKNKTHLETLKSPKDNLKRD